jgi:hypothetical protein
MFCDSLLAALDPGIGKPVGTKDNEPVSLHISYLPLLKSLYEGWTSAEKFYDSILKRLETVPDHYAKQALYVFLNSPPE